jgi:Histidine kinase-, DNA gyrase B-, and HSP90-like ATPase
VELVGGEPALARLRLRAQARGRRLLAAVLKASSTPYSLAQGSASGAWRGVVARPAVGVWRGIGFGPLGGGPIGSGPLATVTSPGGPQPLIHQAGAPICLPQVRLAFPFRRAGLSGSMPVPLKLSVTNTGPLIPHSELDRLFQPFQPLSPRRAHHAGGQGLGLCIVRAIANAHHAELHARARPDGGLHVTVTFPSGGRRHSQAVANGVDPAPTDRYRGGERHSHSRTPPTPEIDEHPAAS